MRIQPNELVPLGHGIWVRSDEVSAIEPIRDNRGPGHRTRVWVRGLAEPLIGSRSEEVILRDLTHPRDALARERRLEAALDAVTSAVGRVPPMLLRVVRQETGLDLGRVLHDAQRTLAGSEPPGTERRSTGESADGQVRLPEPKPTGP